MAKKKKKKLPRYPWDKWFKREKFTLKKGIHYDCMTHSMSVQVRNAARVRGFAVSVHINENTLNVEVW